MSINRWLLVPLLLFIFIETLGYLFWHAADEVCPTCDGTGKVWRPTHWTPFGEIPAGYWSCSTCGGAGFFWRCSAPAAVALYSLFITPIFFGLFFLCYIGDAFYADVNQWVSRVERMHWGFNPMYWAWIFEADRRRWALYRTILSGLFTPLLGMLIFYMVTYERVTFNNSLIGFSVSCIFLGLLALSWYEGFWKPRTAEVKVEEVFEKTDVKEAEYYFPPKPA